jgi:hypothetical protein
VAEPLGRVISLVLGALFSLTPIGLRSCRGTLLWVERTQRDSVGLLT